MHTEIITHHTELIAWASFAITYLYMQEVAFGAAML